MRKKFLALVLACLTMLTSTFAFGGCQAFNGKFTVTFDADGGQRVGGGELVQTIDDINDLNAPVLEKEGYIFIGWDKVLIDIFKPTTVKALWKKEKIFQINLILEQKLKDGTTVKFRLDSSDKQKLEFSVNEIIILPTPISLDTEEYAFSCWKYMDKDGNLVKIQSGTTANLVNFPNVEQTDGIIKLDVYVISRALWTPFF